MPPVKTAKKVTAKKKAPAKKAPIKEPGSKKPAIKEPPKKRPPAKEPGKTPPAKKAPGKGKATPMKVTPASVGAPAVGKAAPAFSLAADDGSTVDLATLRGRSVVLYFYPRDLTPGCTVEACGFRDQIKELEKAGAVVLGVSRDSVSTHKKFRDKHHLPFRLLSDPDAGVIAAYGSWGKKSFMGRTFDGILRKTVLIGKDGKVKKIYPKVTPATHAQEVLADLKALS